MLKIINPISFPSWDRFQKNNVSNAGREKMEFEFSQTGYKDACDYVEERRLQLIESLL